jgi:hypothetical protein
VSQPGYKAAPPKYELAKKSCQIELTSILCTLNMNIFCVRFKVLTLMTMKIIIFWDLTRCGLIDDLEKCEDGCSMLLQNVGKYLPDYMVSHPTRQ